MHVVKLSLYVSLKKEQDLRAIMMRPTLVPLFVNRWRHVSNL